jgi:2-C-methyl-D-erythritol 4-phosphate cytidylyltransferase
MRGRISKVQHVAAVIVAGGTGERFGSANGKQLAPVLGRPVFAWSIGAFESVEAIETIVIVCHPERIAEYSAVIGGLDLKTPHVLVAGGATRQQSVAAGLDAVPPSAEMIIVHDGARPLVTPVVVSDVLDRLAAEPQAAGVIVGHPCVDTLKEVSAGAVVSTPDRGRYWSVQTPQAFRAPALREAYDRATREGSCGTDDSALVERVGGAVLVIEGPRDNIKVSLPEDLPLVEAVLRQRESEDAS